MIYPSIKVLLFSDPLIPGQIDTPEEVRLLGLLEMIAIVLVILWLGGFALHIAGGLIHILLIVALVLFLMRFFKKAA